jgi:hypothetical protein
MSIVQVIIDRTTSMIIEGTYQFDRDQHGILIAPSGSTLPLVPTAGEIFWNTLDSNLYRRNDTNTNWDNIGSGLSFIQHKSLRQLIHFIDNGPADGFLSGAYREIIGTVFPSSVIWYDKSGIGKKKIVSKEITWSGPFPLIIAWKMYDENENILITVVDTITYIGPFETSRVRSIS